MIKVILIPLSLFLSACTFTEQVRPLATVKEVDLQKYLGTWYEIARYEHFFQKGCSDVNATYTLQQNGDIDVLNQCIKEAKLFQARGEAYSTDDTNTKLKVTFFWPFYGNYWVIMLDEDYKYAVIGEPSREYLWILSRAKYLDTDTLNKILQYLKKLDYDTSKLLYTIHSSK